MVCLRMYYVFEIHAAPRNRFFFLVLQNVYQQWIINFAVLTRGSIEFPLKTLYDVLPEERHKNCQFDLKYTWHKSTATRYSKFTVYLPYDLWRGRFFWIYLMRNRCNWLYAMIIYVSVSNDFGQLTQSMGGMLVVLGLFLT